MYELLAANTGEQLIWRRLLENPSDTSCTLSYRFLIKKMLNEEQLNAAIYRFLNAHKELNYRFYEHEGLLYKRFQPPSLQPVKEVLKSTKVLFNTPLSSLYAFHWQRIDEGIHLYVHLSHLVIDGSGFWLLVRELEAAFLDEKSVTHVEQMPKQSEDDVYWQHYLHQQSLHQQIPFLEHIDATQWVSHEQLISAELVSALARYKKNNSVSFFHLLSAALACTLHQYLKDEASTTIIRLAYYVKLNKQCNRLGCDINLLPLFVPCDDAQSLLQILQAVAATRKEQVKVQNQPITQLLNYLDPVQNNNRPLLNVVVNESPGLIAEAKTQFFAEVIGIDNQSAANTLSLVYAFDGEQLRLRFESNQGPMLQELLSQLAHNFTNILQLMVSKPQTQLADLVFRAPSQPVSKGELCSFDWSIIQNNQERRAIVDERETLSYKDLYARINATYSHLAVLDKSILTHGLGLFLTRSNLLPIAMLSALAARVRFIPIAENLPKAIRDSIIHETQLKVLLVDSQTESLLSTEEKTNLQVINLDLLAPSEAQVPMVPLIQNDTAYILFTSGSTGKPKGVMIGYDNLNNFLHAVAVNPGFTQHDTLLALTATSFDISINELLLPLFCGGCLVIAANNVRSSHQALGEMINQDHISVVQATPSTLNLLMQSQWAWHNKRTLRLWVGGEALSTELVQFFKRQNIELYNMYGPTEATIWVSASLIRSSHLLSIGTPLANTFLYVLDSSGKSMPLGMAGELVIEGKLVGQGYINYPNTSFSEDEHGVRRYHTGDKVIALAKNTIVYCKRYDEQVKVRGHRIELEEINNYLRKLVPNFIGLTLLVPQPEAHLCVYYTAPRSLNVERLKAQLQKILPEYKLPQRYHLLAVMPLNNNGKVDRKKLISYEAHGEPLEHRAEREPTTIEQKIIKLIAHQFNVQINDQDCSLLDYGFNSLSFNQLSFLCAQHLDFQVDPHQFYHLNTIKKLKDYYLFNKKIPAAPVNSQSRNATIPVIFQNACIEQKKGSFFAA